MGSTLVYTLLTCVQSSAQCYWQQPWQQHLVRHVCIDTQRVYRYCHCFLQLMDRDPQMAQLLNNPELLRDSMNLISNPVSDSLPCINTFDSWQQLPV
jgi:hypothetical protein